MIVPAGYDGGNQSGRSRVPGELTRWADQWWAAARLSGRGGSDISELLRRSPPHKQPVQQGEQLWNTGGQQMGRGMGCGI